MHQLRGLFIGVQWQSTVNIPSGRPPFPVSQRISHHHQHKNATNVTFVNLLGRISSVSRPRASPTSLWNHILRFPVTLTVLVLLQLLSGSVCCGGNPLDWQWNDQSVVAWGVPPCISGPMRSESCGFALAGFSTTGAVQSVKRRVSPGNLTLCMSRTMVTGHANNTAEVQSGVRGPVGGLDSIPRRVSISLLFVSVSWFLLPT